MGGSTFQISLWSGPERKVWICTEPIFDRSWILTRIYRWCWTYWWKSCSCLRSDGIEVDFFLCWDLDLFLQVKDLQVSLGGVVFNPSLVLQFSTGCWPKLSYPNPPEDEDWYASKDESFFLIWYAFGQVQNQFCHLSGLWSLYYGAVPSRLAKMQTEGDGKKPWIPKQASLYSSRWRHSWIISGCLLNYESTGYILVYNVYIQYMYTYYKIYIYI